MKITHNKPEHKRKREQNRALQSEDVKRWAESEIQKPDGWRSALLELAEAVQLLRDNK